MADIKLRIELNPNADSEALGNITNANELGSTNENLANTSIGASAEGVFYDIQRASGQGSNGLTWAYDELKFDKNGFLDNIEESGGYLESEQNPTQIFWGVVPSSKEYYIKLTFSNATSLKEITILGDKLTKQFPTRAILDGTLEIFNDDPEWNIEFPTEGDTHTIEFTHWNRGNYNATITKIAVLGRYLYIDKANGLKSVETLSQSSSSPSDIFYGVLPNNGSAELLDSNGELHDMIVDGIISDSKVKVDVLANGNVVGTHYTEDTNYSNQSKIVSFEMGDTLGSWDTLMYGGYDLVEGSRTAYQMLLSVFESLGYNSTQVDKMLETEIIYGNDNVVGSVKSYLEQITIQYPYLLADTYRSTINKFCTLAQLQLLQMDNGELKFVSARPVATNHELANTIQINAKDQFSTFDRTAIVKNKIKSVSIEENNIQVKDVSLFSANLFSSDNDDIDLKFLDENNRPIRSIGIDEKNDIYVNLYERIYTYSLSLDLNKSSDVFYKSKDKIRVSLALTRDLFDVMFKDGLFSDKLTKEHTTGSVELFDIATLKDVSNNNFYSEFEFVARQYAGDGNPQYLANSARWSEFVETDAVLNIIASGLSMNKNKVVYGSYTNESQNKNIDTNELIQATANYKGTKISKIIAENILNDYANGIADATVTISCSDYYNENGEKVKDWTNGQVIEVGDIIAPKKDNMGTTLVKYKSGDEYKWRVKGATFRKVGTPFLDLQVQEIRQP